MLALMQRHLLYQVIFRIEGTDADVLYLLVLHAHYAEATVIEVVGSKQPLHLCRQRMPLAHHLHEGNAVERQTAHLLVLVHSNDVPPLFEESHESRRQHDVFLPTVWRGIMELQLILLVNSTEYVVEVFREIITTCDNFSYQK